MKLGPETHRSQLLVVVVRPQYTYIYIYKYSISWYIHIFHYISVRPRSIWEYCHRIICASPTIPYAACSCPPIDSQSGTTGGKGLDVFSTENDEKQTWKNHGKMMEQPWYHLVKTENWIWFLKIDVFWICWKRVQAGLVPKANVSQKPGRRTRHKCTKWEHPTCAPWWFNHFGGG
jgi:hypothetical protein